MDDKGFEVPHLTLRQLNEFSDGGFILFIFDENGNPNVHSKFDTNKDAMALQMFVSYWAQALDEISVKSTLSSLTNDDSDIGDIDDPFGIADEDDEEDLI